MGAGRKLTAKGNLSVADAKALAELLGTDPRSLGTVDEPALFPVRSADDLPNLQFHLRLARASGATRVAKGRLSATKSWGTSTREAQVRKVIDALLSQGPLKMHSTSDRWFGATRDVLDEGLPHILAILFAMAGEPVDYDDLYEGVEQACLVQLNWNPPMTEALVARGVRSTFDRLLAILEEADLVSRKGDTVEVSDYGMTRRVGGQLAMTPLAGALVGGFLASAGFAIPVAGSFAHAPLERILAMVGESRADVIQAEFAAWMDAHSPQAAAEGLARCALEAHDPGLRLAIVHLAQELPPPADEQALRLLLNTPVAGHAIQALRWRGHTDVPDDQEALLRAGVDLFASYCRARR